MFLHTTSGTTSASASITIIPILFLLKKICENKISRSFKKHKKKGPRDIPERNVTESEWKRIPFWLLAVVHSPLMARFEMVIEIHRLLLLLLTRPNLG